ncbi:MAG: DUF5106 domain-containing protein [Fermentimonas sp.]|nr:DUF5106 domain-containing protein [Fermentimonas sp.]
MKNIFSLLSVIVLIVIIFTISCSSGKKSQSSQRELSDHEFTEIAQTIVPDTFVLPDIPEVISGTEERAKYLVSHYWDRFDFSNADLARRPDITEQAFVDYINILNYVPKVNADESLVKTLHRAEADTAMYVHFISLFEKYFYDPNSPFRNEEYYIPVLKEIKESSMLTDESKSVYVFQLDMVMKNRVGDRANNFDYTVASGQTSSLYDLQSDFTLLMFSNPGCPTCEAVTAQLDRSSAISNALSRNSSTRRMLTILTIYPDQDIDEWLAHLPEMPSDWVHAYDKGLQITNKRLYDIKAIPTLYLLDNNKKVILKDTSIEAIESFFTVHQ